jgi:hypothetical protein
MTSEEKAREFMLTLLMTDDARFEQKVAELAAMLPSDAPAKVVPLRAVSSPRSPKRKTAASPKKSPKKPLRRR